MQQHAQRTPRSIATVLGLALAATPLVIVTTSTTAEAAKPRTFANCDAMHRVYPHGVGKPGARDKTSGKPVTSFKRSKALYKANKKSDRDKDGIACEKA
ncbi:MAG TPA: excalibur calcium-binding domain-containing protein [Nocardioides sp.]|uniref:excalibur calcium-binding domain-containing protein n=1 Tax=Nocardioides sp. TaxID=35761 RepID=UPI002C69C7CD|nr:excalibur calcium-binding domain-containing protein [Nocardioides sp.]HTW17322.1 excalibur calcium-binding domain-containing protein [Nocardioides sp.]